MTNKQKELLARFNRCSNSPTELQAFIKAVIMGEIGDGSGYSETQIKGFAKDEVESAQSGTIVDALGLNADGELVKGAVSGGGTKLFKHDLKCLEIGSGPVFNLVIVNDYPNVISAESSIESLTKILLFAMSTSGRRYIELSGINSPLQYATIKGYYLDTSDNTIKDETFTYNPNYSDTVTEL